MGYLGRLGAVGLLVGGTLALAATPAVAASHHTVEVFPRGGHHFEGRRGGQPG
jgi:hypothetical protein